MKTLLWDIQAIVWEPVVFAQKKAEENTHIKYPAAIIVVTALLHVVLFLLIQHSVTAPVSYYLSHVNVGSDLSQSFDDFAPISYFITVAGGFSIIPFWIIGAGVMTCWAILLNGRENFKKVLIINGYAQVPLLLYAMMALVIILVWPPVADLTGTYTSDISDVIQTVQNYREEIAQTIPLHILRVFGYAANLWSLGLLAVGASVTQKMSYLRSAFGVTFFGMVVWGSSWLLDFLR